MAEKQVSVRLTARGADNVKKSLRGVGDAGERGFGRLSRAAARASVRLQAMARRVSRIAGVITAAAVGAAAAMARSSLQTVDAQAKMAQSLGTTTASMQVLARASDLAGVSQGELEQLSRALTRRLSEFALRGGGPAADAIKKLGLNSRELLALPLDQRIAAVNEAIAAYGDEAARAALTSQLFGDRAFVAAQRLQPDTIRQANDELARMGVLVTEIEADQIERANDALSRVGLAARGVGNQIAVALAPHLESLGTWLAENSRGIADWVRSMGDGVTTVSRHFRAFGLRVQVVFLEMKAYWSDTMAGLAESTSGAVNAIVGGFRGAFAAIREIWSALPAVLGDLMISGANAAIGAVESMINGIAERINRFIEGINSAIDRLPERFRPGGRLGTIDPVDLPDVDNPWKDEARNLGGAAADAFNDAFRERIWDPDTSNSGAEAMRRAADVFRAQIADIMAGADKATPAVKELGQAITQALDIPEVAGGSGGGGGGGGGRSSPAAEAIRNIADVAAETASRAQTNGQQIAEGIVGPLKEGLKGGAADLRSSLANILTGWRDTLIDQLFKPVQDALASLINSIGGGGGFLGGIFGGGDFSGAADGFSLAGIYHKGGIAGAPGPSRLVPSSVFANAARYHSGGIAGLRPDEVPAILQRGEPVGWPKTGLSAGGAVTVRLLLDNDLLRAQTVETSSAVSVEIVQQYDKRVMPGRAREAQDKWRR
jgi:hypothetical protein